MNTIQKKQSYTRRRHGDADIDIIMIDNVLSINVGVDYGLILERIHRSLAESRHEPKFDVLFLLNFVLVCVTHADKVAGTGKERMSI